MSQQLRMPFETSSMTIASTTLGSSVMSPGRGERASSRCASSNTRGWNPAGCEASPVSDLRRARGVNAKLTLAGATIVVLFLVLAGGVKAQTTAAPSSLRPLDALGMSFENLSPHLASCQKDCKQREKEAKLGYRVTFDLPPYSYTVESGRVVEVMITADSFQGFINEGSEKWGPPSSLVYLAAASSLGADTRTGTARWDLPGGVVVDVRQTPMPGKVVGVTKLDTDRRPVYYTQKDPPTDGVTVTITRPPAPPNEKVQTTHVL